MKVNLEDYSEETAWRKRIVEREMAAFDALPSRLRGALREHGEDATYIRDLMSQGLSEERLLRSFE